MAIAEAPAQIPEGQIGPVEERELPPAPPLAKMIGPGVVLVGVGIALSASPVSPVVYRTIERTEFVKVGLVLVFLVVALVAAVTAESYRELDRVVTDFGQFPGELEFAVLLGALAYAGARGTNNLVV